MKVYQVFKHPERGYEAVKRGFSWPGFFFGVIWALSRQLWFRAAVLVLVSFFIGLLEFEGRVINPFLPWFFGLVFMVYVGVRGNSWRAQNLEARGFGLLGAINARDPKEAVAKVAASGGSIPEALRASGRRTGLLAVPQPLQGFLAIVTLTWKAAFRYKLFWVIMALLLGAVVGLPLVLKHDGTAEGFAQILITYTLGTVTVLLGLCTLWLACGTLARDVEECQMQMLAVKPIARWQIWLGKWLGLVSLNAALLAIVGLSLYSLLELRARSLAPDQLANLQTQVLVARASAREQDVDKRVAEETDRRFNDQLAKKGLEGLDRSVVRKRIEDQVKAERQSVSTGKPRRWVIHLGVSRSSLHGEPIYLRVKFNAADSSKTKTYQTYWCVNDPAEKNPPQCTDAYNFTADYYHEFPIPSDVLDDNGNLEVIFINPNESTLLFPLADGLEVLYREGGFALNLVRGLGIILCWMGLLAALGLAAASFLSFPVAAFCSLAILSIGLSSGTISNVVSEGTFLGIDQETGQAQATALDGVMIPVFRVVLDVINLVQQFSPVDSLSTGRSVSWSQLGQAAAQIVVLMGGVLAVFGIYVFSRRELATAQGAQ